MGIGGPLVGLTIARNPAWSKEGALSVPAIRRGMGTYQIAGIDVHKRMLAVVIADVESGGEYEFQYHRTATTPDQLRA